MPLLLGHLRPDLINRDGQKVVPRKLPNLHNPLDLLRFIIADGGLVDEQRGAFASFGKRTAWLGISRITDR